MTPRYRVVIHASDWDGEALTLNNAKDLIAGLGAETVEVEVGACPLATMMAHYPGRVRHPSH